LIPALLQSLLGIAIGGGLLYFILRAGKMAFGQERLILAGGAKVSLTDSALVLPDKEILYQDLFYRKSDAIELKAESVDLNGRSYQNVPVRLTPTSLQIGDNLFDLESVSHVETVSTEVVLPREAMGLGDVKFMAAIGAFLGWQAVVFSLVLSSCLGSIVGAGLIAARRRDWSSRLPFGPYLAAGAAIWIFGGKHWFKSLFIQ
jgi:leader peptidase (prepilin peptidase)/N-methyltransferase